MGKWYDIEDKLKILRGYIHVMNNHIDDLGEDDRIRYSFSRDYFLILHNFLIIERMYMDEVAKCGKEINKHLELERLVSVGDIYNKFLELYEVRSRVRFSLETFDSVEGVRIYLSKNPLVYNKLIKI